VAQKKNRHAQLVTLRDVEHCSLYLSATPQTISVVLRLSSALHARLLRQIGGDTMATHRFKADCHPVGWSDGQTGGLFGYSRCRVNKPRKPVQSPLEVMAGAQPCD